MKYLYLMRHGETIFNVRHKIQGWCDSALTENGIQQAKEAGTYIKDVPFDHYYSSTSERCCDTLEYAVGHDKPYTRLKGLKERNYGRFEGESEDLHPYDFDAFYPVFYDGETTQQSTDRMVSTLTEIMDKEDHENVFVCSHSGAIHFFLTAVSKDYQEGAFKLRNCIIVKLSYDDHKFHFEGIVNPE